MSLIDNIRSQPAKKRSRIIWICAGVVAALLFGAWIIFGNPKHDDGSFFNTFNNDFQAGKIFKNPFQQN